MYEDDEEVASRTAFHVVVMPLCAKILEVGKPVKPYGGQFLQADSAVSILVHESKNGARDMVGLLLVLDIILGTASVKEPEILGATHLRFLLRVKMVHSVDCFQLFTVPEPVTAAAVGDMLNSEA